MRDLVTEQDLKYPGTICCGDEDLYPFKCCACDHLMIFCYECDSLHPDLSDLSKVSARTECSSCGFEFEHTFMFNDAYHVRVSEWVAQGFGHLLQHDGSLESRRGLLVERLKNNDEHIKNLETAARPANGHPESDLKSLLPARNYRESLLNQIKALDELPEDTDSMGELPEGWTIGRIEAMGATNAALVRLSTYVIENTGADLMELTPTVIVSCGGLFLVHDKDDNLWHMGDRSDGDTIVCWGAYGEELGEAIRAL